MSGWESRSPTYRSWESMLQRCTNENHEAYERYVDKGVCDEWFLYANFKRDMGVRPKDTTLDRIDNDKGYSKDNCRWATKQTQAFNRGKRKGCTSKYKNVHWNKRLEKWTARYLHTDGKRKYLGSFANEDDAGRAVYDYGLQALD